MVSLKSSAALLLKHHAKDRDTLIEQSFLHLSTNQWLCHCRELTLIVLLGTLDHVIVIDILVCVC